MSDIKQLKLELSALILQHGITDINQYSHEEYKQQLERSYDKKYNIKDISDALTEIFLYKPEDFVKINKNLPISDNHLYYVTNSTNTDNYFNVFGDIERGW